MKDTDRNKKDTQQEARAFEAGRAIRKFLTRFIWWVPAKSHAVLSQCDESVRIKHTAIGVWLTLIIPAIATLSMAEFLKMLDFGIIAAYLGGILWGGVVLGMERVMLAFPNDPNKLRNWLRAIPRFAIALCISYLITETLITRVFRGEIEAEMDRSVDVAVSQTRERTVNESEEKAVDLRKEIERQQNRLDELFEAKQEAEKAMHAEADGTGGTGFEGEGYHYRRRREAFERAQTEYQAQAPIIEAEIKTRKDALDKIEEVVAQAQNNRRESESKAKGALARHNALMSILWKSPQAAKQYLALFLLLMLIELLPLLQKLIAAPDEYDIRIEIETKLRKIRLRVERNHALRNAAKISSLRGDLAERILEHVRTGNVSRLSETEQAFAERIHDDCLRGIASDLIDRAQAERAEALGDVIHLEIVGRPEHTAVLRRPEPHLSRMTIDDLSPEIESIAAAIAHKGELPPRFERAENTLGLEIWPDSPLLAQLEPDRRARLYFESEGYDLGLH